MHRFSSVPIAATTKRARGKKEKKKKKKKVSRLAGSLDILPAWFRTVSPSLVSVRERNAVMKQGSLPTPQTFQPLSTRLFPCWGWTRFLLFSMPSPAWLLVVWWIKGHSCFNWLDFQLINSQVVFAALLALDSPYGICNKKIPFLSASEIATKPEELTPKRCATQKVLQDEQHTLAH